MGLQGSAQLRDLLSIQSPGGKFFQRAEGNAIGLPQGAIDGAGFGHTHLGVVEDEGRHITGMGIAIADEATALGGLIDGSLEDPEVLLGTTQGQYGFNLDASAMAVFREGEQLGMSDVLLDRTYLFSSVDSITAFDLKTFDHNVLRKIFSSVATSGGYW